MNKLKLITTALFLSTSVLSAGCIVHDDDSGCWDCGNGNTYPDPTPDPGPYYERIDMFGTQASASSDGMPGSFDYSAGQALGAPDVTVCGDDPRAWSPQFAQPMPGVQPNGDTIDEYLEITFPEAVYVSQVKIFESLNPGAIVAVDIESSVGAAPTLVLFENYSGNGWAPCNTAFVLTLDGTTYDRYDRVVVYLDTNLVGDANMNGTPNDDYNSIDAVLLAGDVPTW